LKKIMDHLKFYIFLIYPIIGFCLFQDRFSEIKFYGDLAISYIGVGLEEVYQGKAVPFSNLQEIRRWATFNPHGTGNLYLSIDILFRTIYGYIFLGWFALTGVLIRPPKIGIPISIGVYIALALFFTYI